MILRDGTSTEDARLGRLVQYDDRSKNYPVRPLLLGVAETLRTNQVSPRSYSWRIREWHDQLQEGACFPAGTRILHADGTYRPIEETNVLDKVVSAEGNIQIVEAVMVRQDNSIYELKAVGHKHLKATAEHPILVKRNIGSRRNPEYEIMYVAISELKGGEKADYIAVPRWNHINDEGLIETSSLIDYMSFKGVVEGTVNAGGVEYKVAQVPELLAKTYDLGRIIGLYAAEGHTTDNKTVWSFGGHEADTLVLELQDLIKSTLGYEARIQERPNGAINVIIYSKAWRQLFESLVPGTSKYGDKSLSDVAALGPKEYLQGLLDGWIEGDGHVDKKKRTTGVTVCHEMALQFHRVANYLGYAPNIRTYTPSWNKYAETRQDRWDVTWSETTNQMVDDNYVWRKVQSIEEVEFKGNVFNIQVSEDNSYIAEGVGVHNCVAFAHGHRVAGRSVEKLGVLNYKKLIEIYRKAQLIDPWPETREGGEDGTSVLAGAKIMQELDFYNSYRWIFGHDEGLKDAILTLGYIGGLVMGTWWWSNMYNVDEHGFVHPNGSRVGGHAWYVYGIRIRDKYDKFTADMESVDLDKSVVYCRNSWGRSWGVDGDFKLTLRDWNFLRLDQGEAMLPVETGRYFGDRRIK